MLGRLDIHHRLGPGSGAAFILGALAPDVDLVTSVGGWDRYLNLHESGTHTIAASPLLAMAVALTVRAFVRQSQLTRLWWAAWVGVLVAHLTFDLVSGGDMRILAPLHDVRFEPHFLAMADVLAIGILVAGTIWSWRRPRAAALATLTALVVLVAFKAHTQRQALESFGRGDGSDPPRVSAGPPDAVNGSLFAWTIYERHDEVLRVWRVDTRTGHRTARFEWRVAPDAKAFSTGIQVPAVTTFLGIAHVPFPRIEHVGGERLLLWSDLRDCDAARCYLSFGAELDPPGKATRQVIRIGPFEQSRSMPPIAHRR